MIVHIVCGYRSKSEEWTDKWTDAHYRARNLVLGIKREPFRGSSEWVSKNRDKKWLIANTPEGQAAALEFGSYLLASKLMGADIKAAHIVPVPSSQHITLGEDFTGNRIADALHKLHGPYESKPILHFNSPQPRSRAGGSRRPSDIIPHLRSGSLVGLENVILLDDVMTSGGHLRACARYLRNQGVNVAGAIVIGRTVWEKPDNMFKMPSEDLDC